jgi:hypothetical protein
MTSTALAIIETRVSTGKPEPGTDATHAVKLIEMPDSMLGLYRVAVIEHQEEFKQITHAIDLELERRIRERKGREFPHPSFSKIALEDQWTPYAYDFDLLKKAQQLLGDLGQDEDAAKICRHVPEQVITNTVPAHDEAGPSVSLAAIVRKYGEEHEISKLLLQAQSRESLGQRLVVKQKVGAK